MSSISSGSYVARSFISHKANVFPSVSKQMAK